MALNSGYLGYIRGSLGGLGRQVGFNIPYIRTLILGLPHNKFIPPLEPSDAFSPSPFATMRDPLRFRASRALVFSRSVSGLAVQGYGFYCKPKSILNIFYMLQFVLQHKPRGSCESSLLVLLSVQVACCKRVLVVCTRLSEGHMGSLWSWRVFRLHMLAPSVHRRFNMRHVIPCLGSWRYLRL